MSKQDILKLIPGGKALNIHHKAVPKHVPQLVTHVIIATGNILLYTQLLRAPLNSSIQNTMQLVNDNLTTI